MSNHSESYSSNPIVRHHATTSRLSDSDSDMWFQLSVESDNPDGRDILGDFDTNADAEEAKAIHWAAKYPANRRYEIKRIIGSADFN